MKLILRNFLSPGDIVMLTAAVRDLHACYPGKFVTDVRTPFPELWQNNPYLTPLGEDDPEARIIDCQYPLIHQSNQRPYHFIHAFIHFLNEQLHLEIKPTAFKGYIHLSEAEKSWESQVQIICGDDRPFWLVTAGGKHDFTCKWWETRKYQAVVDHFHGKILFVQVGRPEDHHPALKNVIDLRGCTNLRHLVRLVYHSQGVLCPVTGLMHLAAAVPMKPKSGAGSEADGEVNRRGAKDAENSKAYMPEAALQVASLPPSERQGNVREDSPCGARPCVVVAGGREPPHWEAYPHHQFIHTVGALPCCRTGGCWKSRVVPLGDGDEKDLPGNLCENVVGMLPRCMDMITADEVIRRIELWFTGGALRYLTPEFEPIPERFLQGIASC